jgi:hypothetical protein
MPAFVNVRKGLGVPREWRLNCAKPRNWGLASGLGACTHSSGSCGRPDDANMVVNSIQTCLRRSRALMRLAFPSLHNAEP